MSYQYECLYCHAIHFVDRKRDIKKFCNRSHAASYNSSKRTKASRDKQKQTLAATLFVSNRQQKPKIVGPITEFSLYPKSHIAKIKYTALYLNKDKNLITYKDVNEFKEYLEYLLNYENLSPAMIAKQLSIVHTDFGLFLRKCMGLKLKSLQDAMTVFNQQTGRIITSEKLLYWDNCGFNFSPFSYPKIIGYELLSQYKIFHTINNPNGLQRDHMISKAYGWENNIDPSVISHPANCAMLLAKDNISKGSKCSISLETLLTRIKTWDEPTSEYPVITIPTNQGLTQKQKEHLSNFNKTQITYTNGKDNIRQHKDLPPPIGYRKGVIKKRRHQTSEQYQKMIENRSNSAKNSRWYTDGVNNIKQHKDLPIPLGYKAGRTK